MSTPAIPNRAAFRSQEVCEIAEVQPYVLKSWEAEFPDLGLSKGAGSPRVYRRADVERVLHLKHLLFVEGLTLAGARRQMIEEGAAGSAPSAEPEDDVVTDKDMAALLDREVRKNLEDVRNGLHWILGMLNGGTRRETFALSGRAGSAATRKAAKSSKARAGKAIRLNKPARSARSAKARKGQRAKGRGQR